MSKYIVVFDDDMGLCVPYGEDSECTGALEAAGTADVVMLFDSRKDARKAIAISVAWTRLRRLQGHMTNEDFLPTCREFIKVKECKGGEHNS